jgi:hypothetical protein
MGERSTKTITTESIAIIGCTNHPDAICEQNCYHSKHADAEPVYYTIDSSAEKKPDLCQDIKKPIPNNLNNHFTLVITERLDFTAFSASIRVKDLNSLTPQMNAGLQNLLNMTAEDGFILFDACPRFKEYRQGISALKFIEHPYSNEVVLIPKNQNLSIEEVRKNFENLAPHIKKAIQECCANCINPKDNNHNLEFTRLDYCNLDYLCYNTFPTFIKERTQIDHINKFLQYLSERPSLAPFKTCLATIDQPRTPNEMTLWLKQVFDSIENDFFKITFSDPDAQKVLNEDRGVLMLITDALLSFWKIRNPVPQNNANAGPSSTSTRSYMDYYFKKNIGAFWKDAQTELNMSAEKIEKSKIAIQVKLGV